MTHEAGPPELNLTFSETGEAEEDEESTGAKTSGPATTTTPAAEEEPEIDPRTLLTQEQIDQYKQLFTLLDVQGKGKLPVKLIGQALRSLGFNPRQSEIKKTIAEIDPDNKGYTDFNGFLLPIARRMDEIPESAEQIIQAFKVFDPENKGRIPSEILVEYLTTLGEKLEDFEIESFVKAAGVKGDGNVDYREFTFKMFGVPKKIEKPGKDKKPQKGKKK